MNYYEMTFCLGGEAKSNYTTLASRAIFRGIMFILSLASGEHVSFILKWCVSEMKGKHASSSSLGAFNTASNYVCHSTDDLRYWACLSFPLKSPDTTVGLERGLQVRAVCISSGAVSFVIKNEATLLKMAFTLGRLRFKNLYQEQEKGKKIKRLEQTGALCTEKWKWKTPRERLEGKHNKGIVSGMAEKEDWWLGGAVYLIELEALEEIRNGSLLHLKTTTEQG